jgi:hypothetical protein
VNYQDYLIAVEATHPGLAIELGRFQGVSDFLEWMRQTGRTHASVDIIGQDEFEYDFLIELQPGGDWLALGIT